MTTSAKFDHQKLVINLSGPIRGTLIPIKNIAGELYVRPHVICKPSHFTRLEKP